MPTRLFYTIDELGQHWNFDASQIWQWLIDGELAAHTWLPLISVFRLEVYIEDGAIRQRRELQHWQGHALLSRFHCLRLFQSGKLTLREISCREGTTRFVLPDEADDLVVSDQRVVVLHTERTHFEKVYGIRADDPVATCPQSKNFDPSFRSIDWKGTRHYFGSMQAAILSILHEAALEGEPWVNGKQILHQVGSHSFTLANVFQGKPIWKEFVESDGRGYYRLCSSFVGTVQQGTQGQGRR